MEIERNMQASDCSAIAADPGKKMADAREQVAAGPGGGGTCKCAG